MAAEAPSSITGFLRTVTLFADLGGDLLEELALATDTVSLAAGAWLFREGDATDSLYVVRSGRVQVLHEDTGEVLRVLAPTDVVGELALLTNSPRAASARAMRDTVLVEMRRDQLASLLRRQEGFATALLALLGRRLQQSGGMTGLPAKAPSAVAVVAATVDVDVDHAVAAVVTELPSATVLGRGPTDIGEATRALDEADLAGSPAVLVAPGRASAEWRSFCLRQADRVLLVADPGAGIPGDLPDRCDIVFAGTGDCHRWLRALQPRCSSSTMRGWGIAARRLVDTARALVLSGGGARGLAHVGAVYVLAENGFVPDVAGGCSIGAFVGGMVAMGWEPARIERVCRTELVAGKPFRDYTIPKVSLIKARRAEAMLLRIFGNHRIEELPVPYFAVAADLVSGDLVVARTGLLREAIGASMSLPGLAPPVRKDDRLLVDGGVVDNLPVDVLLERERAFVVAVDVMRRHGTDMSSSPRLLDTIARAATLGSWPRTEENRTRADVVITPQVADIGLLEFDAIDRAIAAGRAAAEATLSQLP